MGNWGYFTPLSGVITLLIVAGLVEGCRDDLNIIVPSLGGFLSAGCFLGETWHSGGVGPSDSDDVRCHLPSDPVTVSSRTTCKLHAQSSRDWELNRKQKATVPG